MMGRIYGRCKIRIQDHSNNVIMHMNECQKKKNPGKSNTQSTFYLILKKILPLFYFIFL